MSAVMFYVTLVSLPVFVFSFIVPDASYASTWKVANRQLHEPLSEDLLVTHQLGEFDAISLVSVGSELKRTAPAAQLSSGPGVHHTLLPELHSGDWEERFLVGESASTQFVDSEDAAYWWRQSWVPDRLGSSGAVPLDMARAEELLNAAESAPDAIWKEKTAVRSLRMYHHARWLAERGHTKTAESRFREAANLATRSRRSILASHSLGRLGYFLIQWCRPDEAKVVLAEAERLNMKSNPLAKYLHGVILRKEAVNSKRSNPDALRVAEDKILEAGPQPSEELEAERALLVQDILFWRRAEKDPWQCIQAHNVAHAVTCACGHLASAIQKMLL